MALLLIFDHDNSSQDPTKDRRGCYKAGDVVEVEILPSSVRAKVRGIQVHNESVSSVAAGVRTAINVQGIEKSQIERGEVLTTPGTMLPTRRVDAWVEYLATAPRPLKDRTRIRFHSGTAEVMGEALVLGGTELLPGQGGFIQLVFETPLVLLPHDRYVIRSYSMSLARPLVASLAFSSSGSSTEAAAR